MHTTLNISANYTTNILLVRNLPCGSCVILGYATLPRPSNRMLNKRLLSVGNIRLVCFIAFFSIIYPIFTNTNTCMPDLCSFCSKKMDFFFFLELSSESFFFSFFLLLLFLYRIVMTDTLKQYTEKFRNF